MAELGRFTPCFSMPEYRDRWSWSGIRLARCLPAYTRLGERNQLPDPVL
jgi:hypothetical protein